MCVWRVWGIELKCAARLTLTMIWNFAVAGMNKKKYIEHRHTRHKKIEKKENMVLNDSLYRYTVHGITSFNVLSHCIYSRMSPSHSVAVISKRILCMCDRKNRRTKNQNSLLWHSRLPKPEYISVLFRILIWNDGHSIAAAFEWSSELKKTTWRKRRTIHLRNRALFLDCMYFWFIPHPFLVYGKRVCMRVSSVV